MARPSSQNWETNEWMTSVVVKCFASPLIGVLTGYSAGEAFLWWCSRGEVVCRVPFDSTWRAQDTALLGAG